MKHDKNGANYLATLEIHNSKVSWQVTVILFLSRSLCSELESIAFLKTTLAGLTELFIPWILHQKEIISQLTVLRYCIEITILRYTVFMDIILPRYIIIVKVNLKHIRAYACICTCINTYFSILLSCFFYVFRYFYIWACSPFF